MTGNAEVDRPSRFTFLDHFGLAGKPLGAVPFDSSSGATERRSVPEFVARDYYRVDTLQPRLEYTFWKYIGVAVRSCCPVAASFPSFQQGNPVHWLEVPGQLEQRTYTLLEAPEIGVS